LLKTEFEPTVPMSSYLVALVISNFVCLNETVQDIGIEGKVDVNVCGRANAIEKLRYALIISTKTIKFLESIYGVKYPLKKAGYKKLRTCLEKKAFIYVQFTDHIAIPDFNAGAMENWGLILYRESRLFYDPETSSKSSQQDTAVVISHELGHMWFGNLVTMKWYKKIVN
jgi:aminopeptidase N